jgi:hypothetical protein
LPTRRALLGLYLAILWPIVLGTMGVLLYGALSGG